MPACAGMTIATTVVLLSVLLLPERIVAAFALPADGDTVEAEFFPQVVGEVAQV